MKHFNFSVIDFFKTAAILMAAFAASSLLKPLSSTGNSTALIFVLAVVIISRITRGYFYGLIASLVSMFCINYFFTFPYSQFNFSLSGYPVSFLTLFAVSATVCALTAQAKTQTELAIKREKEAKELLAQNQKLSEERQKIRMVAEQEKIRNDLLRSISHDLRTPLTSIYGSSGALLSDSRETLSLNSRKLLEDIRDDSEWLIRMIENLLIVTKISSSHSSLRKTKEAAEEIVSEAIRQTQKHFPSLHVEAHVPDELLFVPMDPLLIEQVLINLLENAIRHSGDVSHICLKVTSEKKNSGRFALFSVSDRGRGLSPEVLDMLKGKNFSSLNSGGDSTRGMGIGLSVCQSIIEAHHGFFEAENSRTGGAVFQFGLPLEENE